MGTTRSVVKKDSPEWLRCQHTIRKLLLQMGKDALVYAKGALEHEDSEPERLKVFWELASRYFEDYEMPAKPKAAPKPAPKAAAPEAPVSAPDPVPPAPEIPAPAAEKEA